MANYENDDSVPIRINQIWSIFLIDRRYILRPALNFVFQYFNPKPYSMYLKIV